MGFEPTIIDSFPEIPRSEVKLLWHCDYLDGALSGMLHYQGEMCWFEVIVENESDEDESLSRRFAVIGLTTEDLADEQYWHELFRKHVGTHTDYADDQRRAPGQCYRKRVGTSSMTDTVKDQNQTTRPGKPSAGSQWVELTDGQLPSKATRL